MLSCDSCAGVQQQGAEIEALTHRLTAALQRAADSEACLSVARASIVAAEAATVAATVEREASDSSAAALRAAIEAEVCSKLRANVGLHDLVLWLAGSNWQ